MRRKSAGKADSMPANILNRSTGKQEDASQKSRDFTISASSGWRSAKEAPNSYRTDALVTGTWRKTSCSIAPSVEGDRLPQILDPRLAMSD